MRSNKLSSHAEARGTIAPDAPSQAAPFVQSGGLLLQGLAGTPAAYVWTTSPAGQPRSDHVYASDGTVPEGYTDERITGYLHQGADAGTAALTRYLNATTGAHFYATSGDYVLDTSITPPTGYTYQATLGYLRPTVGATGATLATVYTRNALGQVVQVTNPNVSYTYTYDAAHRLQSVVDSRGPKRLTYTYSPGGLRNSVTDSDGNATSYLYDAVGRLSGIWAPTGDRGTEQGDVGYLCYLFQKGMKSSGWCGAGSPGDARRRPIPA